MKVHDILTLIYFGYRNGQCPLFGTHNPTFYPDKFADRQIRQLVVTCENKENGCAWSDTLEKYEVTTKYRFIFSNEIYCTFKNSLKKEERTCKERARIN